MAAQTEPNTSNEVLVDSEWNTNREFIEITPSHEVASCLLEGAADPPANLGSSGWIKCYSEEHQCYYYHNIESFESQWDKPEEIDLLTLTEADSSGTCYAGVPSTQSPSDPPPSHCHPQITSESSSDLLNSNSGDPRVDSRLSLALVQDIKNLLQCSVCFEVFSQPISLPCGHTFCRGCLRSSIRTKSRCPLCRAPVAPGAAQISENTTLADLCRLLHP